MIDLPVEKTLWRITRQGENQYPRVFRPLKIRDVTFQNRLFFAPMGLDLANHDGTFSPALGDFYQAIMGSGCGSLILSNATVSRSSILQPKGLRMFEPYHAEVLQPFIAKAQQHGVVVGVQLQHYGGQGTTTYSRGKPLLTPSGVPTPMLKKLDPNYRVREMTLEDIDEVKRQFAMSARICKLAGAKMVQLQASNGYLLGSFLSRYTNRRSDLYGGSAQRRARLLVEVVEAVRAEIGEATVLSVRLGIDDYLGNEGMVPEDLEHVMPLLEQVGTDLIEASICINETFHKLSGHTTEKSDYIQRQVRKVKGYTHLPVGYAGLVDSLEMAEAALQSGCAEMIGMARALFADNELIIKSVENRHNEIDRCLWDGKCFKDKYNPRFDRVYCCVNNKYRRPE